MINIRRFDDQDSSNAWEIIEPVFRAGEACPFSPDISDKQVYKAWIEMLSVTFVATNEAAVYLWKKQGFALIGTLPGTFRHQQLGFVDAYVMFKQLET